MTFKNQLHKTLFVGFSLCCMMMINLVFGGSAAYAQIPCAAALNGTPPIALPYYFTDVETDGASSIVVNDAEQETIRYEYHLLIDPVILTAMTNASEVCIEFETNSEVISINAGEADYASSLKFGHMPVGASSFTTFAQHIDTRDTRLGDSGVEIIDYAESVTLVGITLNDGDQLGVVVNGEGATDAATGSHFDQAVLEWFVAHGPEAPRLVIY